MSNGKYGNRLYHNSIIDTEFETGILKSCISDHFAIMLTNFFTNIGNKQAK